MNYLLRNVNFLSFETKKFLLNKDIFISDGVIKDIGDSLLYNNCSVVDLTNKFIIPGMIECHAHMSNLTHENNDIQDMLKNNEEMTWIEFQKKTLEDFVRSGITQIRDVGGSIKKLSKLNEQIQHKKFSGPQIFYSGPMLEKSPLTWEKINENLNDFTVAIDIEEDIDNIIKTLISYKASLIKTFGKFDIDLHKKLLNKAKELNLPVTHDPGPPLLHDIPVDIAIKHGVSCIEHSKSPWQAILKNDLRNEINNIKSSNQNPKKVIHRIFDQGVSSIDFEKLDNLISEMLKKDVHFCPTLQVLKQIFEKETKSQEHHDVLAIMIEIGETITRHMMMKGVKILVGHDGFTQTGFFNEVDELSKLGLSNLDIIKGATKYPAEWLRIDNQYGDIRKNKKATFSVLNSSPIDNIANIKDVFSVYIDGERVYKA